MNLKRPPNAFFLFQNEIREQIKLENPNLNQIEISKIISKKWKELDLNIKEKYEIISKENFKKFKIENPNYNYKLKKNKKIIKKNEIIKKDPISQINDLFQSNPFTLQILSTNIK